MVTKDTIKNILRPYKFWLLNFALAALSKFYMLIPKSFWGHYTKLEIGSGPLKRDGWLTLDFCWGPNVIWNLNKKLPFPDNCFETIYSSHVLEHFNYKQLKSLLAELHRVLKPNGKMLICVPDASKYIQAYKENDSKNYLQFQPAIVSNCRMDFLNYIFYMDGHHHFMFDHENLKWHLEKAGFINYVERDFIVSIDSLNRQYESLYAQCEKQ